MPNRQPANALSGARRRSASSRRRPGGLVGAAHGQLDDTREVAALFVAGPLASEIVLVFLDLRVPPRPEFLLWPRRSGL